MTDGASGFSRLGGQVGALVTAYLNSTSELDRATAGSQWWSLARNDELDIELIRAHDPTEFVQVKLFKNIRVVIREAQALRSRLNFTLAHEIGHASLTDHEPTYVLVSPNASGKSALLDGLHVLTHSSFELVDEAHRTPPSLNDVSSLAAALLTGGAAQILGLRLRVSASHAEILLSALTRLLTVLALLVLLVALTYAVVRRGFSLRVIAVSMRHRHRREPSDGSFLITDRIQSSMVGVSAVH